MEALAARLTQPLTSDGEPPVVVLNKDTSGPPFAFLHGDWTGVGWYSRRLAKIASPDSPFMVLATIGTDKEEYPWTIEEMAARQVDVLKQEQPRGPYRIGGFCVGGVVAYEMARQLEAAGEVVEKLVVVDSGAVNARLGALALARYLVPPGDTTRRLTQQAHVLHRLRVVAGKVRAVNAKPLGARVRWLVRNVVRRLPVVNRLASAPEPLASLNAGGGGGDGDEIVMWMQRRATSAYVPGRYHGTMDLIWASGAPGKEPRGNPLEGWRHVVKDIRLHVVPSQHIGLITEDLPALAQVMQAVLARGNPDAQRTPVPRGNRTT